MCLYEHIIYMYNINSLCATSNNLDFADYYKEACTTVMKLSNSSTLMVCHLCIVQVELTIFWMHCEPYTREIRRY